MANLQGLNVLVTGGAGVIGSEMVKHLSSSNIVTVLDNLSSGVKTHLDGLPKKGNVEFILGDIRNKSTLMKLLKDKDIVFHFAANGDVRYRAGTSTDLDLESNTMGTYNVLEAMRQRDVKDIVFSSSSSVYGEATVRPTSESYGPLIPTSLYGASKLACEGLIGAFHSLFGLRGWIYRFANITARTSRTVGMNVVPDFIEKLSRDPSRLEILGDGHQTKSYLFVDDCISGMLKLLQDGNTNVSVYNLGSIDTISVTGIADIIVQEMNLENVRYEYTGGQSGWIGDVPQMFLDITKAREHGWTPINDSKESIRLSAKAILDSLSAN